MAWKNTGQLRIRLSWLVRRCIIQVEQRDDFHKHWFRWRDASFNDLQEIGGGEIQAPSVEPRLRLVKDA